MLAQNPQGCVCVVFFSLSSFGPINTIWSTCSYMHEINFSNHLQNCKHQICGDAAGFEDAKNACCRVPSIDEGWSGNICKRGASICSNSRSNVFFDGLHPTETVNAIIANKAYYSNSRAEVYPMNIMQLSQL